MNPEYKRNVLRRESIKAMKELLQLEIAIVSENALTNSILKMHQAAAITGRITAIRHILPNYRDILDFTMAGDKYDYEINSPNGVKILFKRSSS